MAVVSIVEVTLAEVDTERLRGRNIEVPTPGARTDGHEIDLIGWVLGRDVPAVAVEVVYEGAVVRRALVDNYRPDIEEAFADVSGAAQSGFRTTVGVTGMGELELEVRAVLRDQSRVPLGKIRARRRWREGDYDVGAALVSVVIPCHNQAHFLGEAIESVLAQTYPHFEVVVVDDGSTDNTQEVASRYPGVRCIRQENRGLAGARNEGIRRSRGSHLVFLDADDRLLPNALEVGLRHLKERPECAFVAGRYRYIAFDGSPLPTPPTPVGEDHHEALLCTRCISTPAAVMYQRLMLEFVGGFDTSASPSADYDLYLRVARKYPVHQHDEVVAENRRHGANMTRNAALMLKSEVTVLRTQWRYVRRRKQYKKASEAGLRHSREYFGGPLVEEVRAHMQKREWQQAIRGLLVLLRYYSNGFASVLRSR
jgi:glycosyltransferase involved in cell wall biosynthesis